MAVPKKIINFLEKSKIKYEILEHKTVYTAFDKAQTLGLKTKIIGKTLALKGNGGIVLILIPANRNLDLAKFKKAIKAKKIDFLSEKVIKNKFKGVKVGTLPPFGNLWKIPTLVDNSLLKEREIILNAGDYNFSIKIKGKDLEKLIPDLRTGSFGKAK